MARVKMVKFQMVKLGISRVRVIMVIRVIKTRTRNLTPTNPKTRNQTKINTKVIPTKRLVILEIHLRRVRVGVGIFPKRTTNLLIQKIRPLVAGVGT